MVNVADVTINAPKNIVPEHGKKAAHSKSSIPKTSVITLIFSDCMWVFVKICGRTDVPQQFSDNQTNAHKLTKRYKIKPQNNNNSVLVVIKKSLFEKVNKLMTGNIWVHGGRLPQCDII